VFKNRVLRKYENTSEEVTGDLRKMYDEELQDLYS
jgi:hypothetical protein